MINQSSGFNAYAAGSKVYNGGMNGPTIGMVGSRLGTRENQLAANSRRNALLRRLQAGHKGNMMSPDWLRGPGA